MIIKNFQTLYVSPSFWIVAKGYKLYKYNPQVDKLEFFSRLVDKKNSFLSRFKLTQRLFRAEILRLYHFKNDNWLCIAKSAIFRYNKKTELFEKCCVIKRGSRPLALCQTEDGTIYYGEYGSNPNRMPMRIMLSKDDGLSWSVAYAFADGEINHIHGVFCDSYTNRIWVATGDDDSACIFGYTEDSFKSFVKKYRGSQQYRVCVPMFTDKEIIYATDSQYNQNVIRSINRENGKINDICEIQGSGIYGVQLKNGFAISTTVEPSAINLEQKSQLWFSSNGRNWVDVCSFEKDIWEKRYFQFGTLRFPTYEGKSEYLVITGRAVKKLDGKSLIMSISNIEMHNEIRASVAMAVYNGEKYLHEQIDSILAMMEKNDELVISYNESLDSSLVIIKEYESRDSRIKIVYDEGKSCESNFNNAIKHCRGKYVFLSDQDDIWINDKINTMVSYFERYPNVDIIMSNGFYGNALGEPDGDIYHRLNSKVGFISNFIKGSYLGCQMAFTRRIKDKVFPVPILTPPLAHDLWLGIFGQLYGKFLKIDEKLIIHRIHGNNTSNCRKMKFNQVLINRSLFLFYMMKKLLKNL